MQQKIIILDFGSQTTQLIGRRVRELDTFCEILPYNKFPKDDPNIIGVILSGSPYSVHDWVSAMVLSLFLMLTGERSNRRERANMVVQILRPLIPIVLSSKVLKKAHRYG